MNRIHKVFWFVLSIGRERHLLDSNLESYLSWEPYLEIWTLASFRTNDLFSVPSVLISSRIRGKILKCIFEDCSQYCSRKQFIIVFSDWFKVFCSWNSRNSDSRIFELSLYIENYGYHEDFSSNWWHQNWGIFHRFLLKFYF